MGKLVADKNMEMTLRGILARWQSLDIREITFDILPHPEKDPGCLNKSDQFLRIFINQYRYALVLFDREGCGRTDSRDRLETEVEHNLNQVGWRDRSAAIALDPELETWVWTQSPHVAEVLGWRDTQITLRAWLVKQDYLKEETGKPSRPKEAMEAVLEKVKKSRSSALYRQLAEKVGLRGHQEPAFVKLQTTLKKWFPKEDR